MFGKLCLPHQICRSCDASKRPFSAELSQSIDQMLNHASERFRNFGKIREYIATLERDHGLWKAACISDQAWLEDEKDAIVRILNLIDSELEQAGLWDRSIEPDDKDPDRAPGVTLDHIAQRAKEAKAVLQSKGKM